MTGQRAMKLAAQTCASGRMAAWRAHTLGGVDETRLEWARRPALRSPTDLLVRVHSSSINPLDVAMLGGYGRRALGAWRRVEAAWGGGGGGGGAAAGEGGDAADGLPLTVGRDFAGEVALAGPGAALREGALVWGVSPPHRAGAHAQYVLVDEQCVALLPASMQAVGSGGGGALYCGLTALSALRAGDVPVGGGRGAGAAGAGRVLVVGGGGVAQAALQLAAAAAAETVALCSAGAAAAAARALGAAHVIDRRAADLDRLLEESGPYEVIVDAAGLGGEEAAARRWRFSRYVTVTSPALRETDAAGLLPGAAAAAAALLAQNIKVARRASPEYPRPQVRWAFFRPCPDGIQLLTRLAERGEFVVKVEEIFPWWRADEAYRRQVAGSRAGKLILDFTATYTSEEHSTSSRATNTSKQL